MDRTGDKTSGMQPMYSAIGSALPDVITVYTFSIGDDRDIALHDAVSLLSSDEVARADRFHFDRDRMRYSRARGQLRRVLGNATKQDPAALVFDYGAQGKPHLLGDGPEFNLSHSGDLAVIAVSQDGPVGVDVEHIDRKVNFSGLAESCMTEAEQHALAAADDRDRAQRFFAFWTAKEARMKLTGAGMTLPPKSISLGLSQGWPVRYELPIAPDCRLAFAPLASQMSICCVCYLADDG